MMKTTVPGLDPGLEEKSAPAEEPAFEDLAQRLLEACESPYATLSPETKRFIREACERLGIELPQD